MVSSFILGTQVATPIEDNPIPLVSDGLTAYEPSIQISVEELATMKTDAFSVEVLKSKLVAYLLAYDTIQKGFEQFSL